MWHSNDALNSVHDPGTMKVRHLIIIRAMTKDIGMPLTQGPLNLAIILLPRFYNTEGNVSLFVSGGVFALALEFGVAVLVDVVYESAALRSTERARDSCVAACTQEYRHRSKRE
jgi:hypothetical protein